MINNHFVDAPTVGSHDRAPTVEELQSRIHNLEQRSYTYELKKQPSLEQRPQKKKFGIKKIVKLFCSVIVPILAFIPNVINATANYKRAVAKMA